MKTTNRMLCGLALVLASAAMLSSCGKSTTTVKPNPLTKKAADVIAVESADRLITNGAMYSANSMVRPFVFAPAGMRSRPARPARVGTVTTDSTVFWYEMTAFDAAGDTVDWTRGDGTEIARIKMAWRFYIEAAQDDDRVLLSSEGQYEFTGLAGAEERYVMNGDGREIFELELREPEWWAILHLNGADQMYGVAWQKSGSPSYPVAGRFVFQWHGDWDFWNGTNRETGNGDADCVVTFNGTEIADLLVGGYHYTLNLVTGEVGGLDPGPALRRAL